MRLLLADKVIPCRQLGKLAAASRAPAAAVWVAPSTRVVLAAASSGQTKSAAISAVHDGELPGCSDDRPGAPCPAGSSGAGPALSACWLPLCRCWRPPQGWGRTGRPARCLHGCCPMPLWCSVRGGNAQAPGVRARPTVGVTFRAVIVRAEQDHGVGGLLAKRGAARSGRSANATSSRGRSRGRDGDRPGRAALVGGQRGGRAVGPRCTGHERAAGIQPTPSPAANARAVAEGEAHSTPSPAQPSPDLAGPICPCCCCAQESVSTRTSAWRSRHPSLHGCRWGQGIQLSNIARKPWTNLLAACRGGQPPVLSPLRALVALGAERPAKRRTLRPVPHHVLQR